MLKVGGTSSESSVEGTLLHSSLFTALCIFPFPPSLPSGLQLTRHTATSSLRVVQLHLQAGQVASHPAN
jgi:hypothetical protein